MSAPPLLLQRTRRAHAKNTMDAVLSSATHLVDAEASLEARLRLPEIPQVKVAHAHVVAGHVVLSA